MPVKRRKPDGLPFNLYERHGVRVYTIFYKDAAPPRARRFSISCSTGDKGAIASARRTAIKRAADMPGARSMLEVLASLRRPGLQCNA